MSGGTMRSALAVGSFFVAGLLVLIALLAFFGDGSLFRSKERVVAYFDGSLSGLSVGAPVTFRGVRVGSVEKIELRIDGNNASAQIPVFLSLNSDAAEWNGGDEPDIERLVQLGLRAQLASLSFVTGQLYIELDFYPDRSGEASGRAAHTTAYTEIPTLPSETAQVIDFVKQLPLRELVHSLRNTLERIDRMTATVESEVGPASDALTESLQTLREAIPQISSDFHAMRTSLDQVADDTSATLATVDDTVAASREEIAVLSAELQRTAESLRATTGHLDTLLAADAPARRDIETLIRDLARSARSLRRFSETVEEQPNSLIFGR